MFKEIVYSSGESVYDPRNVLQESIDYASRQLARLNALDGGM